MHTSDKQALRAQAKAMMLERGVSGLGEKDLLSFHEAKRRGYLEYSHKWSTNLNGIWRSWCEVHELPFILMKLRWSKTGDRFIALGWDFEFDVRHLPKKRLHQRGQWPVECLGLSEETMVIVGRLLHTGEFFSDDQDAWSRKLPAQKKVRIWGSFQYPPNHLSVKFGAGSKVAKPYADLAAQAILMDVVWDKIDPSCKPVSAQSDWRRLLECMTEFDPASARNNTGAFWAAEDAAERFDRQLMLEDGPCSISELPIKIHLKHLIDLGVSQMEFGGDDLQPV